MHSHLRQRWLIPFSSYFWIGLAPFVLISLFGLLLVPQIPVQVLSAWLFGLIINATGSVGDLYVVGWLLLQKDQLLIQDFGDRIVVFQKVDLK